MNLSLSGMSADQLDKLVKRASLLAADLRLKEPSVRVALANGVVDNSYNTQGSGYVTSYRGSAIVELDDGSVWRAVGHGPKGDAYSIYSQGYVEFIPQTWE